VGDTIKHKLCVPDGHTSVPVSCTRVFHDCFPVQQSLANPFSPTANLNFCSIFSHPSLIKSVKKSRYLHAACECSYVTTSDASACLSHIFIQKAMPSQYKVEQTQKFNFLHNVMATWWTDEFVRILHHWQYLISGYTNICYISCWGNFRVF
jgi:hypothetical protein